MTDTLEPVSADLYRRRVGNGDLRKLSGVDWGRGSLPADSLPEETQNYLNQQYEQTHEKKSPYSIWNAMWLITSIATFYYSDFYPALLYDTRINRFWFNLGAILIGVNITIGAFLILWTSCIKKIPSDEWERQYPAAIPTATASFILGVVCVTIGLWPVWSILTPLILFLIFMGCVVIIAMIPDF
ncbi:transmembrane protein 128-like isoform X1 [Argonauta hians]